MKNSIANRFLAASWSEGCTLLFTGLLFSAFSLDLFDLSGQYFFEGALFCACLVALLPKNPVCNEVLAAVGRNRMKLLCAAVLLLPFLLIGVLRHGNYAYAYGDYRANLFCLFGFVICGDLFARKSEAVMRLATATTIMSAAYWAWAYSRGELAEKYTFPLFAAVLSVLLALSSGKTIRMSIGVACLIFLAAVSFFRQYLIVASLTVALVLMSQFTIRRGLSFFFSILLIGSIGYFGSDALESFYNSDESHYIQSIGKINDAVAALNGGAASESDTLRMAYFEYLVDEFPSLILPHGLGYRGNGEVLDPWFLKYGGESGTLDSVLVYLAFHYGFIVLIPLAFWYFARFFRAGRGKGIAQSLLLLGILFVPLLFEGAQLTVLSRSFWFGAYCAFLLNRQQKPATEWRPSRRADCLANQ